MTESLKCPECSAPLEQPSDGAQSLTCPYCNCSVLLDRAVGGQRLPSDLEARLLDQLRAGDPIAAIRLYREHCRVDLRTAKEVIDRLAANRFPNTVVIQSSRGSRVGWWVAGILLFIFVGFPMIIGLLGMLIFGVHSAATRSTTPAVRVLTPPTLPAMPAMPDFAKTKPATPAFARLVNKFGSEGIGPGQFKDHRSIAVDGSGQLYVGEYEGGRVQVFDSSGKFLRLWYTDKHNALSNLAANREGTLLAIIAGNIFCYEGATGRQFGQAQRRIDQWTEEIYKDACFALTGEIYALDLNSNIVILNSDGQIQKTIPAKHNTGDDEVNFDKIAVSGDGHIFTLDPNHGLFVFASDGRYINRFATTDASAEAGGSTLHMGFSLAVDGQNRLYVGDMLPGVKVFDINGRYLGGFGDGEVCFGVAVTDQDQVVGCFRNRAEVRRYELIKK